MNVKFTREQSEWLQAMTGENNLQSSVNFFLHCMEEEDIPRRDILILIEAMMKRKLLPPGKK